MATTEPYERLRIARKRRFKTAREASEVLGIPYGTYTGHESGTRGFSEDIERYAKAFRVRPAWLAFEDGPMEYGRDGGQTAAPVADAGPRVALSPQPQRGGQPNLAVLGIALGGKEGDGDFLLNGSALDFIPRPAGLIGRPAAFAIILRNTSMEPVYKHGWPIFIDPEGRKPVEGEDVLIELYGDDPDDRENGPAFIKTLVARRGGQHILRQYNPPPEELRFDSARVKNLYRVIPYPEAMGLSV